MTVRDLQFTPSEAAFIADLSQREIQKAFDEGWFDLTRHQQAEGSARRRLGPAELVHLRLVKNVAGSIVIQSEAKKLIHRQLRERMPDLVVTHADHLFLIEVKWHSGRAASACANDDVARRLLDRDVGEHFEASVKRELERWVQSKESAPPCVVSDENFDSASLRLCFERYAENLKEPVRISRIFVDVVSSWEEIADRLADATAAQFTVVNDPEIRGGEAVVRGTRVPVYLLQDLKAQGATDEELLADYPSLSERHLNLALLYARTHPRAGRPRKHPWQSPGGP